MASPSTRPLLSAALIVKDEEAMLPRCLAALDGIVDEVVVVDTGSSDRTVAIAEAAGAVVHRSSWHDDFARARNESLSYCTGRWVIYVDADEELRVDDVAAFREDLAHSTADAFTVRIHNIEDHSGAVAFTHDPTRLFRRTRFTFEGRIHEHVVARTAQTVDVRCGDGISIRHYGYTHDVVASRDKVARNLRLAEAAWEASPEDVLARIELARSLAGTTRHDETMSHLRALREAGGATRHTALTMGMKVLLDAGQLDEALEWGETLRTEGATTVESAKHHADVLFQLARHQDALQVLDDAPESDDLGVHGTRQTGTASAILRARLLQMLGQDDEAVDLLVALAPHGPDSMWPELIELLRERGELDRAVQPFLDGLVAFGEPRAHGVLGELTKGPVEVGDEFAEALAAHPDGLFYAFGFVLANADRLTAERAAAWSSVARAAGLDASCVLVRRMDSAALPPLDRFTAAAMVVGTYGDERGRPVIVQTADMLFGEELPDALYVISELAPEAFLDLVIGYVRSQRRALGLADALVALGASDEAIAVLEYGQERGAADPRANEEITAALAQLVATP